MSRRNKIFKFGLPLILLFLAGYFILQSTNTTHIERDVYFEYSAKCNMWEVRDMESGILKSRVTEGLKQLYDLSGTRNSPLIKIDGEIVGHTMDGTFDWTKPFSYTFLDAEEAKQIYGKDARFGLAEFTYNSGVISEFKACTTTDTGEDLVGMPLILYDGTLSQKPKNIAEEREFNGLQELTGQFAKEAYGERAEKRPVFNYFKSDAVSELKVNDKSMRISNGASGKIILDYSSDRMGEIDVLINQEYEQMVTSRHQKSEKTIRIELDPSDWPPYNFTISVFKAGTDFGIESRLHRLTNGNIEIDYITEDNNRQTYVNTEDKSVAGETINYVTVPGEQMRLPETFFRQINYIISNPLFKVADPDYIAYWHQNLRAEYKQIEYQRYVTSRFKEEAESFGFDIIYNAKKDQLSVRSNDASVTDININSWLTQNKIPASLRAIALDEWEEQDLPLLILDHQIITRPDLLEKLTNAPLSINRFTELTTDIAIKRFGEEAKNGALVFRGIKASS